MIVAVRSLQLLLLAGVAWLIWKRQTANREVFWPALLVRVGAGLCLGWLYTSYYAAGDTFTYLADASRLAAVAREDFSRYADVLFAGRGIESLKLVYDQPRALFLVKIVSVFSLLTVDSYWLISIYFSFISFLGAWSLVQTISRYIPDVRAPAVAAFLFLPSVVFWTSGILKESLALAGLLSLSAIFLRLWFSQRLRPADYLLAALSVFVTWNLKYYYLAVFIPVVTASLCYRRLMRRRPRAPAVVRAVAWLLLLLLPVWLIMMLHPNLNAGRIFDVMVNNYAAYHALSGPGEAIVFEDLDATWQGILINAPWALISGLFRPQVWETDAIIPFLAGVENALLLLLFIASLFRLKRLTDSRHRLLTFTAIVFVVVLCVFLAISAPNFGTLSRFRSGYLPFFAFLVLCGNPLVAYAQRSVSRLVSH